MPAVLLRLLALAGLVKKDVGLRKAVHTEPMIIVP